MDIQIKTDLILKPTDGGRFWIVHEPFVVKVDDLTITVPKGYVTDFASIKYRFVSPIMPRWGKHGFGTVVHDYLYDHKEIVSRKRADKIFNELMKHYKTKFLQRLIAYWAVRMFGWIVYNGIYNEVRN
jgi:hypothetical protein